MKSTFLLLILPCLCFAQRPNPNLKYAPPQSNKGYLQIHRGEYQERLEGFWLGTCIANWTGLVTEMDKIGNIGEIKTGDFYTREDWGKADLPNIWSKEPSKISPTIDFVLEKAGGIWGADDDTDIEYIYQELLLANKTSFLNGKMIREGWLKHIQKEEENYLWVSNETAFQLMQNGLEPPETGNPQNNKDFEMIDAQLTTEVFGLYAPSNPELALKMAYLPIRTTAFENSAWIAEFYVKLFSLASTTKTFPSTKEKIFWMAGEASSALPEKSYSKAMYDFAKKLYAEGKTWEQARDAIYQRYQVEQADGYDLSSKNITCNACFAAGINFAASLVSLFWGEGDLKETIKIGSLAGWDSDNPTATWGGLLGFMLGKKAVEESFGEKLAENYNIHRTRIGFPNKGIDSFERMAEKGVWIIDRVVQEELGGFVDLGKNSWFIPSQK